MATSALYVLHLQLQRLLARRLVRLNATVLVLHLSCLSHDVVNDLEDVVLLAIDLVNDFLYSALGLVPDDDRHEVDGKAGEILRGEHPTSASSRSHRGRRTRRTSSPDGRGVQPRWCRP